MKMMLWLFIGIVMILLANGVFSALDDDFAHAYNFDGDCVDTVGISDCTGNSLTYSTTNSPDGENVAVMVQSNPSWMDYQDLDTTRMTGNSTVCMLFNTTDVGTGLLNKGPSSANPGWELYGSGGSYTLYEDGSGVGSAGTLTGNSWELICVSHNDTGIYTWEDGNLIITGTGRTPGSTTGQDFRSGTNPPQSTAWSIEGHVRFVYMWDRDLTNTEITELYNSGNYKYCSGDVCSFAPDTSPPNITNYNMTSDGGNISWRTDNTVSVPTTDGTPQVTFDTDEAANCSMRNTNHTYDSSFICSTTGGTSHICNLYNVDKLSYGTANLYIGCNDTLNNAAYSPALAINMTAGTSGGLVSCINVIGNGCGAVITNNCAAIIT